MSTERHRGFSRDHADPARVPDGCQVNGASLCQKDLDLRLVGSVSAGSGSDLSEESVVGVEPAALDVGVAPGCPPGLVSLLGCASRTRRR
jgi:hypothetical protein